MEPVHARAWCVLTVHGYHVYQYLGGSWRSVLKRITQRYRQVSLHMPWRLRKTEQSSDIVTYQERCHAIPEKKEEALTVQFAMTTRVLV